MPPLKRAANDANMRMGCCVRAGRCLGEPDGFGLDWRPSAWVCSTGLRLFLSVTGSARGHSVFGRSCTWRALPVLRVLSNVSAVGAGGIGRDRRHRQSLPGLPKSGGSAGATRHLAPQDVSRYIENSRFDRPLESPVSTFTGSSCCRIPRPLKELVRWTKKPSIARKRCTSESRSCESFFDYPAKQAKAAEIEARMSAAGFWDNPERAQETVTELKALNSLLKPLATLVKGDDDLSTMLEMADEDESFAAEMPHELDRLEPLLEDLELKSLLSGPHDASNAILTINARDGGVDANDWAEMLMRMYTHWAAGRDYEVEVLDRQDNLEAGIQSATLAIRGPMAYGYLKGETGIHRLVRISPFNAEGKRQTSFAAVDVSPEVGESAAVELRDEDIREDVFRASGAGGQHVNKTSSAIRLTHFPSGIVVQCQNERSQHKNRATAIKMLKARLARQQEEKREAEEAAKYNLQPKVGFGSQIRNYFLHPDQRVKDARTGFLVGSFQSVMDGNIQGFLEAYLREQKGGR